MKDKTARIHLLRFEISDGMQQKEVKKVKKLEEKMERLLGGWTVSFETVFEGYARTYMDLGNMGNSKFSKAICLQEGADQGSEDV